MGKILRTWQDEQRRCMSISLWLIFPQPKQCHQDRFPFPSSAWIMHQRTSTDIGTPPSTPLFSGSGAGGEEAGTTTSHVVGGAGGSNHHGGARFPFGSVALDGSV